MLILLLLSLTAPDPQPTPAQATKTAATAPEKRVCREFPVTGSLVGSQKVCKTRREWDIDRERIRASGLTSGVCGNQGISGNC
ncbi:hypothetical protein E2E30_14115 [Sphingomonas sp. AAP5]|uniref:Uncharacterized protein n=1 Tax=Sphingomonas glacialis TaxID=658225 RepID=A0ABQ3LK08_9SPHN|nr:MULTISPECIES: hypothetical protein [Sphingomonas]QBM76774.1 hypothetical protein E2E30_14115 [Sphingomonas sp. AAP5]GHH16433.1 hypothetical protein GCM10008023_20450 [Sphingomonas glacialis]